MAQNKQSTNFGVRIGIGFLIVLVLLASITALGLAHISETNGRLRNIVENNNVKTKLANAMQTALRERALSMHALSVLTDPFEKDDEVQRFNSFGSLYLASREKLEGLSLTPEEHEVLRNIAVFTRAAQPEVQAVVDLAITGGEAHLFDEIRNKAMPRQREIADEVNTLIAIQEEQTKNAVSDAELSYAKVRSLMFGIGALAVLIGLIVAVLVTRRVARQAEQLVAQALYDPLTSLPNRTLLQDRLEREILLAKRSHSTFAVALMDLDRFKEVNDTLGHKTGDELLREVGRRLQETVRGEDTVARLGGDEYVIILHGLVADNVTTVAEKILHALDIPFQLEGQTIDVAASLGIALYPQHGQDAGALIRQADIAMYVAKRSGSGAALYSPEQEKLSRSDLSLKSELREAIHSNQLQLHYQPKIDHLGKHAVGLEALVRWNHPQRGYLSPDKFIPLAEEAGLIGPLSRWVIETALMQLAQLRAQGHALTVSVNLSARNLHDTMLPATIAALLAKSGIHPEHLTLELTESAVMSSPSDGLRILRELDAMGVILAIDDFGTGYSSLSYLKQLPVDELKIDKSFVMDMEENDNDAVIVRSTIDLAHNLGLKVTAEGVETQEALNTLDILGCDTAQGYYMSKPLPFDRLQTWLHESPWAASASVNRADFPLAATPGPA